jgi:putative redox protein
MKISLERINEHYLFELKNQNGHSIRLDNTGDGNAQAVSPMESLLMALAGCSSIDMVSILKKQHQEISRFTASVEGEREQVESAKPFRKIHIVFHLEGTIDPQKAERAAALSFEKYCSVSMSLDPQIKISWEIIVNGQK